PQALRCERRAHRRVHAESGDRRRALRTHLRRVHRVPCAEGGVDGERLDPHRRPFHLAFEEARRIHDPREQHRPDHRVGGREHRGEMARTAYMGLFFAIGYAVLQQILKVIAEVPGYVTRATSRVFPAATVNASITPEYMGVGYIIGPRIAGVLVSGGVLAWLGIIPLIASLVPADTIASQLVKLGYLADAARPGAYGWDPATHAFGQLNRAIYFAYVRQIGAGAVA